MAEKPQWDNTSARFVTFMDIMGFRDRLARNSHEQVLRDMQDLCASAINPLKRDAEMRLSPNETPASTIRRPFGETAVRPVLFPDSILLISSDDSLDAAANIVFSTRWLLEYALLRGIPMKGAIAWGRQTADFDISLHFGQPLIDAFQLQNELYLYGVALHHSTEKRLHNICPKSGAFQLYGLHPYPTPLKSGVVTHFMVGWRKEILNDKDMNSILFGLYDTVSGASRLYVDNTARFALWLAGQLATGQPSGATPEDSARAPGT